jgi:hypothetical protein
MKELQFHISMIEVHQVLRDQKLRIIRMWIKLHPETRQEIIHALVVPM